LAMTDRSLDTSPSTIAVRRLRHVVSRISG
jgi:hypothetical protein